jgi:hypothetical protein
MAGPHRRGAWPGLAGAHVDGGGSATYVEIAAAGGRE